MMCNPNPNYTTLSGSNQNGSPTGNQPPTTNPYYFGDFLEASQKWSQEMGRKVLEMRDSWLKQQLIVRGMPASLIESVSEPGYRWLAAKWIELHGFTTSNPAINSIALFQHGKRVAFAKLFEMPTHADETSCGYD
jgi:hypothetical protein